MKKTKLCIRKQLKTIALAMVLCCVAFACSDDDELQLTQTLVNVNYPTDAAGLTIVSEKLTMTNLSTGKIEVINSKSDIYVESGLYDITYTADVQFTSDNGNESCSVHGVLSGKAENVSITDKSCNVSIDAYLSADNDDFIIEEIFFTGTLRASGSQYYGDSYIKIYNNTDHVLYADGVGFCESKFKSTQFFDYSPDIRKDTMTVQSLYIIPGSGHDHPVQPGESLILCDTGIDHRNANPNSIDLSAADFEWYDVSQQPAHLDIDSESVPNLDKWYCYTESFYVLHNRGFTSYALVRVPIDKESFLRDFWYTYDYTMYLEAGTFPMQQQAYKMPNNWILDGVNCSVEASRAWNILPPSVDAGWTHCGMTNSDKTRYFKSVRRKVQYVNPEGTRHLKDTNNSSNDFNTECVPSVVELQHSAVDADGTKAEVITLDGVMKAE